MGSVDVFLDVTMLEWTEIEWLFVDATVFSLKTIRNGAITDRPGRFGWIHTRHKMRWSCRCVWDFDTSPPTPIFIDKDAESWLRKIRCVSFKTIQSFAHEGGMIISGVKLKS